MSQTGMQFGIFGMALVRPRRRCCARSGARRSGCCSPCLKSAADPGAQLGLTDPGIEEVMLSPVVVRNLATDNTVPRRRLEFLVPARQLMAELSSRNVASAEIFFEGVMGVVYGSDLFHIEVSAPNILAEWLICTG